MIRRPGSDDGSGDNDPQDGDDQGADNGSDAPPSCDPAGTGEVMDAPAGGHRAGRRRPWPSPAEIATELRRGRNKPGTRPCTRRRASPRPRASCPGAAPSRRRSGARMRAPSTGGIASPPLHDRRREARLQLEPAQPAFHRLGPLPALDPLRGHRHDRRHRRHLGLAAGGDPGGVLDRASRDRHRASAGARHPPPPGQSTPPCRTPPNTPPRTCPTRSRSRAGAGPTSGRASPGSKRTASVPASASTSPTCCARATSQETEPAFDVVWANYAEPPGDWNREPWGERIQIEP